MMLTRALAILASLLPGQPPPANDTDPKAEYRQEYYYSFKGNPEKGPGLDLFGPDAEESVKFEPAGLRITLPPGYEGLRPNTGVITRFAVKGDFEITVGFEILQEPDPADSPRQTRFTLFVPLDAPGADRATLSRRVTTLGATEFLTWLTLSNEATGKKEPKGDEFPTETKAGRLRLVRNGSVLSYHVAEGADGAFTLLQKYPFAANDLKDVRIVGSTGGRKAALDVRVIDLRIRADALPNVPAATVQRAGKMLWVVSVLALGLVITFVLGMWLYTHRCRLQRQRVGYRD
jgi:hypothetical protein